jgi:hypothetical protein
VGSPYLTFHPRRVAGSLTIALVLVPALALVTKTLVEGLTPLAYEIHWLETVPVLVVLFALGINGLWNERAREDRDEGGPGAGG